MDPETYENAFKSLDCAEQTRVQYLDSRDEKPNDQFLDDETLLEKLPAITSLVEDVAPSTAPATKPSPLSGNGKIPYFIIFATGSTTKSYNPQAMSISRKALQMLMDANIFVPHFIATYSLTQPHFSQHVEYDAEKLRPIAIHIYLRLPRNSMMINVSMRVRLHDLAFVCVITSKIRRTALDIKLRCIRQSALLQIYPLHFFNFVLERRAKDFDKWVEDLWRHVGRLERKTGMTPWGENPHKVLEGIEHKDFTGLLQKLHAAGVELRLAVTVMNFAKDMRVEFKKLIEKVEELRREIGKEELRRGYRAEIEDQIEWNGGVLLNTSKKVSELLDRTNAQINVTYSLIAQKSSEQNINVATGSKKIAELTAEDSRTMKTITVLTLAFLPSTMLSSLWSAGIFTLDSDQSWRVYLGTTFALTAVVFCAWGLYIWIVKRAKEQLDAIEKREDSEKGKIL